MSTTTEYPVLPDYEELPPPQPIQQATADEAGLTVLSTMVDLWEMSNGGASALEAGAKPGDQFSVTFTWLAYSIMRHEKAQAFCAANPVIIAELRRYTAYLFGTTNSIYWTLCDFDYCLKQLV